eukprot:23378_1
MNTSRQDFWTKACPLCLCCRRAIASRPPLTCQFLSRYTQAFALQDLKAEERPKHRMPQGKLHQGTAASQEGHRTIYSLFQDTLQPVRWLLRFLPQAKGMTLGYHSIYVRLRFERQCSVFRECHNIESAGIKRKCRSIHGEPLYLCTCSSTHQSPSGTSVLCWERDILAGESGASSPRPTSRPASASTDRTRRCPMRPAFPAPLAGSAVGFSREEEAFRPSAEDAVDSQQLRTTFALSVARVVQRRLFSLVDSVFGVCS